MGPRESCHMHVGTAVQLGLSSRAVTWTIYRCRQSDLASRSAPRWRHCSRCERRHKYRKLCSSLHQCYLIWFVSVFVKFNGKLRVYTFNLWVLLWQTVHEICRNLKNELCNQFCTTSCVWETGLACTPWRKSVMNVPPMGDNFGTWKFNVSFS